MRVPHVRRQGSNYREAIDFSQTEANKLLWDVMSIPHNHWDWVKCFFAEQNF